MQTEMIPVQSSLLSAVGYNAARAEFLAQFNSGTLGAYASTTKDEFDAVLASESVGKAFNSMIKQTKHYRKVDPAAEQPAGSSESAAVAPAEVDTTAIEVAPVLSVPEHEIEVQQQTTTIAEQAQLLTITTPAAHVAAQELIVSISAMKKQVETFFEPMKTAAHKAHKAVCNRETEMLKPLAEAQKKLSEKIVAFEKQVEADRKAEEERRRIEAQAIAEREAKEEAERLALEDAIELEEQGDTEGAAAVLANPVPIAPRYVPAPIVPSQISRVSGAVVKETWKARVVNAALVPREWLMVDEAALNKHAANRKQMAVVPGVEFYPETHVHGRSIR
jgi:KTSC domain